MSSRFIRISTASVILIAAAVIYQWRRAEAHVRVTTNIRWASEIRPLMRDKCMTCHAPGGMAKDFDMSFYKSDDKPGGAWAWRKAMEEAIQTGVMPPWRADERFGEFANSRALTEDEKFQMIAWALGGGPQGTPQDLPTPPEFVERTWSLGEPDLTFELPEHAFKAEMRDDAMSVKLPIEIEEDAWITGFEFLPGAPHVVHAVEVIIHDPEGFTGEEIEIEDLKPYDPLKAPEELEGTRLRRLPPGPHFLGQWVRGDAPVLYPPYSGKKLRAGSTLEARVTYRRHNWEDFDLDIADRTKIGLFLTEKGEEVDLLVESIEIANKNFTIPAGEADFAVSAQVTLEEDVHLFALNPRLGPLARKLLVTAHFPDGMDKTLLWIPNFEYKWEASYVLARPLVAPAGTRLEVTARYDNTGDNPANPNSPPVDVACDLAPGGERLSVWVDTTLDDHLVVPTPSPTPGPPDSPGMMVGGELPEGVAPPTAATPAATPVPEGAEVFWCPMHVTGFGACRHNYPAPGVCTECGMTLLGKGDWFATYMPEPKFAADHSDWPMTEAGARAIYWCPNRGMESHTLKNYPGPGRCEVCGAPLAHQAQFETVRTYVCMSEGWPCFGRIYYGSGICPTCLSPVQAMGHMDHSPVHGGHLIMAENLYHHVEGALPTPTEFRMFFYDDWKTPIDPRNFAGRLVIETFDAATEEFTEHVYPLKYAAEGAEFLSAAIPPVAQFPVDFNAWIWLAGEEKLFSFAFSELTREPTADERAAAQAGVRLHEHEEVRVELPETAVEVVREILKRDAQLKLLIEAEDWYSLHYPAAEAQQLAAGLRRREEGLSARERQAARDAAASINQGAIFLDQAGDAADAPRVRRAYEVFAEGVAALKRIFPDADR